MRMAQASGSERSSGAAASSGHVPVLLGEVLALLGPRSGATFVDATLGGGGYTEALLEASAPDGRVVAFDRDRAALLAAENKLAALASRLTLVWGSFAELDRRLGELGLGEVDGVVADLGLSSLQLDEADRGFAFSNEGPLDMRFDRSRGRTAAELVNTLDEAALADLLYELGEERRSRAIARRIVERRPILTTGELRKAVVSVLGPKRGRVDPATRTFQALRIAVNDELAALAALLEKAPARLAPGGRLVVVSYHSLEDREVKLAFRELGRRGEAAAPRFRVLTKKPLVPGEDEVRRNPRARSAKLRALERAA